jgi:hypothetical protein
MIRSTLQLILNVALDGTRPDGKRQCQLKPRPWDPSSGTDALLGVCSYRISSTDHRSQSNCLHRRRFGPEVGSVLVPKIFSTVLPTFEIRRTYLFVGTKFWGSTRRRIACICILFKRYNCDQTLTLVNKYQSYRFLQNFSSFISIPVFKVKSWILATNQMGCLVYTMSHTDVIIVGITVPSMLASVLHRVARMRHLHVAINVTAKTLQ